MEKARLRLYEPVTLEDAAQSDFVWTGTKPVRCTKEDVRWNEYELLDKAEPGCLWAVVQQYPKAVDAIPQVLRVCISEDVARDTHAELCRLRERYHHPAAEAIRRLDHYTMQLAYGDKNFIEGVLRQALNYSDCRFTAHLPPTAVHFIGKHGEDEVFPDKGVRVITVNWNELAEGNHELTEEEWAYLEDAMPSLHEDLVEMLKS
jgi:hypothetical protein